MNINKEQLIIYSAGSWLILTKRSCQVACNYNTKPKVRAMAICM